MSKRLASLLLVLAALLSGALCVQAEAPTASEEVSAAQVEAPAPGEEVPALLEEGDPADQPMASQFPVFVDGQPVADAHSILDKYVTYVSACNVTRALFPDAEVTWSGDPAKDMVLTGPDFTMTVRYGRSYVICNDRYLYTPGQILRHPENGDLLLPVRVLCRALGASLEWDPDGVYLTSGGAPLTSGETFYNADDLYLLARTIRHEAGYEPFEGQIAVGNVVLNRVHSGSFPNTVRDVIYQRGQFSSSERATPTEQNFIAAKLALDGAEIVPASCCWFNTAGQSFWGSTYKSLRCVIGHQAFYG